jgi:5'-deoxynucleotidase YfbR-like HD superfamily hydrolase
MTADQLAVLFRSFNVRRFHTTPVIQDQTVGDHTARVMVIAIYLAGPTETLRYNLLLAILEHDGLESITGDIPATTKWIGNFGEVLEALEAKINEQVKFGAYELLNEEDKLLLKVADMAELCARASQESIMGNRFMGDIFNNGARYLTTLKPKMPPEMWERLEEILGPGKPKTPLGGSPTPPAASGPSAS